MTDEIFDADDPAAAFPELAAVLGSDAVWDAPPLDLEDRIVAEITAHTELVAPATAERSLTPPERSKQPRWLIAVAAVSILIGGIAAIAALAGGDDDAPTGEVFALEATELGGDATGQVELTELLNGLRIILTVDDLPPAPEGQFYEAWMASAQGPVTGQAWKP